MTSRNTGGRAPRETRYESSRESRDTASSLPHRPAGRSAPPIIVDVRPDDRRDQPRRRETPRPAPNPRGPAGPPQPRPSPNIVDVRPNDRRDQPRRLQAPPPAPNPRRAPGPSQPGPNDAPQPRPPADRSPNDLPKLATEQPLKIDMDGKPARDINPELLGAVYRVVNLALDILESERSFEKLVYIGATCVRDWGDRKDPKNIIYPTTPCSDVKYRYKKPSTTEMGTWVLVYLGKIRQCFPPIDIRRLESRTHAMFGLLDWEEDAKEHCFRARQQPTNQNIMLNWHALDSGVMRLHLDSLTAVAQSRTSYQDSAKKDDMKRFATDYQAFLVDGALTVAHELVHCFVRFLSGNHRVGTPRSLMPQGYEDRSNRGESGRMWEALVLGGCVSYSLPEKKGGTVRLMVDIDNKEAQVDPDHIKDIAKGKIKLPLKTVGRWVSF